jgi:hypothetical protein
MILSRSSAEARNYSINKDMRYVNIAIIGAVLTAFFSLTTLAETPAAGMSGIEGTIVVSPTRPGPIRKEEGASVAPVPDTRF